MEIPDSINQDMAGCLGSVFISQLFFQQDLTQLLLPSSLKLFPSLGFLEATLDALPSQRVLLASLPC